MFLVKKVQQGTFHFFQVSLLVVIISPSVDSVQSTLSLEKQGGDLTGALS